MKKITFILIAVAALIAFNARATTHTIQVGVSNGLTFTPSSITTVLVGDIIRWEWATGSHTTFSTAGTIPSGAATWNNAINSSNTFFEYTVTVAGSYSYQCSPHGPAMSGSFTASTATPITDKTSLMYTSFEISPNPTSDLVNIKFSAEQNFKASVLIFDGNGKEKISKKIEVLSGDNSHSFPIANFPKGVYYLTILDGSTSFISKKFVKE